MRQIPLNNFRETRKSLLVLFTFLYQSHTPMPRRDIIKSWLCAKAFILDADLLGIDTTARFGKYTVHSDSRNLCSARGNGCNSHCTLQRVAELQRTDRAKSLLFTRPGRYLCPAS